MRHRRRWVGAAALASLAFAVPVGTSAHEVPSTATVLAFVKPEGQRLRLLVRVPVEALRDLTLPVRGQGYLDIARADSMLREAARLWIAGYVELYEEGRRVSGGELAAARVALPSDRSFERYEDALAAVTGPALSNDTDLPAQQAMLDVLFEYPIDSDQARFSIQPAWAHLGVRTTTVLRFVPANGAERAFQYSGNPGLVRLDPRWHQSALRFVVLGFQHILDGIDHLLFVLCLVIPVRRIRPLVAIVTSFTVAHSITLIAAAFGLAPSALWFPPLIEMLIALSIVFMALENIVGARLDRRWMLAFAFGLVHGFGFSFALSESLQFAGGHLLTALLSFNIGVELGQLLVVALAVPLLALLFRHVVAERMGTIVLSALVAHSAWHWMGDRWSVLRQYRVQWPPLDLVLLASVMRGLMLLALVVGIAWLLSGAFARLARGNRAREATGTE